jgi:formate-dependent phosphoribosylglycinamide formyltransferase (GAR transformylase)
MNQMQVAHISYVILATLKVEIEKIVILRQPGQIVHEIPSPKNNQSKLD